MTAIDVLLPIKGPAPFLAETLRSLAWQREPDFRVVVVDDGLVDDDHATLAAFRARLRVHVVPGPRTGIVGALNAGIDAITAPLVARVDADDVHHPDRLRAQRAALDGRPDAAFSAVGARFMDGDGLLIRWRNHPPPDDEVARALAGGNAFIHPGLMMRTDALRALGGYRARYLHNEDYDLVVRAAARYRFANVDAPLVAMRVHGSSVSRSFAAAQLEGQRRRARDAWRERAAGTARIVGLAPLARLELSTLKTLARVRVLGPATPRALVAPFATPIPAGPPPSVGVLIPARNMAATLGDTLASIAAQTSVPDRVVLVDDGSTDDTARIARASGVVDTIIEGPARGLAAARNAGLAALDTDWVIPLDADDLLEPDWVARVRGIVHRVAVADVVTGTWLSIDEDGTRIGRRRRMGPLDPRRLAIENTMTASGVALRRAFLRRYGDYDEGVRFAEDWELWQRLAPHAVVVHVDAPSYRLRHRAGSMVREAQLEKNRAMALPRIAGAPPELAATARALLDLDVATRALGAARPDDARRYAQAALTAAPGVLRRALPILVLGALPAPLFNAAVEARRAVRRALGALADEALPAPLGRADGEPPPSSR